MKSWDGCMCQYSTADVIVRCRRDLAGQNKQLVHPLRPSPGLSSTPPSLSQDLILLPRDPPASASLSTGMTGVFHLSWLEVLF